MLGGGLGLQPVAAASDMLNLRSDCVKSNGLQCYSDNTKSAFLQADAFAIIAAGTACRRRFRLTKQRQSYLYVSPTERAPDARACCGLNKPAVGLEAQACAEHNWI